MNFKTYKIKESKDDVSYKICDRNKLHEFFALHNAHREFWRVFIVAGFSLPVEAWFVVV